MSSAVTPTSRRSSAAARASSASSSAFASSWSRLGMRGSGSAAAGQHVAGELDVAAQACGERLERTRRQGADRQEIDRLRETGRLTRHGRPQPPLSGFLSSYFRILL